MWTIARYAQLVEEMRQAQKDFFAKHTQTTLANAKRLEQRVDAATLQIVNSLPQQDALFALDSDVRPSA